MSKTTIITSDENSITLVVKNHYSLSFNRLNNKLSFISANINIQESVDRWTFNFKSITFAYGKVMRQLTKGTNIEYDRYDKTEYLDNYCLVLHKSYRNNYEIKKGFGKHDNFIYAVMPSKIFKQFRYEMYNLERKDLISTTEYGINFVCKKQRYNIEFENGKLYLKERAFLPKKEKTFEIKSYTCRSKYLLFDIEGKDFYLSEVFLKSFIDGKRHFGFIKDVTHRFDIWEYFMKYPVTEEEQKARLKSNFTIDF